MLTSFGHALREIIRFHRSGSDARICGTILKCTRKKRKKNTVSIGLELALKMTILISYYCYD